MMLRIERRGEDGVERRFGKAFARAALRSIGQTSFEPSGIHTLVTVAEPSWRPMSRADLAGRQWRARSRTGVTFASRLRERPSRRWPVGARRNVGLKSEAEPAFALAQSIQALEMRGRELVALDLLAGGKISRSWRAD